jgi:uncharacterized protein
MRTYITWLIRYRWLVLGLWIVLTVLAGWMASTGKIAARLGEDMIGDRPEFDRYIELSHTFRSDGIIIVGVEDEDMLSETSLKQLRTAVESIKAMPDIAAVDSILDAQRMIGDGKTLELRHYTDEALAHQDQRDKILTDLSADPLMGGLFLSKDSHAHALQIEMTIDENRIAEASTTIVNNILNTFVDAGYQRSQIHRAGFTAGVAESIGQLHFNTQRIFPAVTIILLLLVWLLFRRLWPAAVAMAVALTSVVWTVGFLVALEGQIHTLVSLLPPVILIVAFSDVVHLCSAYLIVAGRGMTKLEAIKEATSEVGKACLLTSATTFAGFASLGMVPQPAMRVSAIALAFGVAAALLLALTLVPVFLSFGKLPKPMRKGATAVAHRGMDWMLEASRNLAVGRPKLVTGIFAVVTIVALLGVPRFTFDIDFERRYDESNSLTQDADWFKDNFAGTNMLEVYVDSGKKEGLLDADSFATIARYQDALLALSTVDTAQSLVDLIKEIHLQMMPAVAKNMPIPDSRQLLAQYLLLFESSGGEDLERIVDFERRQMVISLRLVPHGARATQVVGQDIIKLTDEQLSGSLTAEPSGIWYLMGFFFEDILDGQTNGLALSFVLIALLMVIGLRSLRTGLLSMIPNLLPVVVLTGYLGWCHAWVDSDVVLVLVMAIGIGVDDTIHFLSRYRVAFKRLGDHTEAIKEAFAFAGRGIMMTTIILIVGFLPCYFSGYITMQYLGTLLPLTLIVALLADILLVPALITLKLMRVK